MARSENFDKRKSKRKHSATYIAAELLPNSNSCSNENIIKKKKKQSKAPKHSNSRDIDEQSEDFIETGKDENSFRKKKAKHEKKVVSGYDGLCPGEYSPKDLEQVIEVSERDDLENNKVSTNEDEDDHNEGPVKEPAADYTVKHMEKKKNDKIKKKKKKDRWGHIINDADEASDPAYEAIDSQNQGSVSEADGRSQSQNDLCDTEPTICVGGMPYDTTEEDILNHFGECGTIENVMCARFTDTNRFKGLAYITFKEGEAVQKALGLDGSHMGDRCIKVDRVKKAEITVKKGQKGFMEPPKREEGSLSVYIGNLDWNVQKIDVKRFFKGCGIDNVRLAMDRSSGKFLGYGHVDFSDDASLDKAIKMNQQLLFGRPVRVSYAVRNGFKTK